MKDSELKKLVQQEIATCLGTLTWDVAELKRNMVETKHSLARIESGLFGDKELAVTGLAEKIEYSYNYAKKNIDSKIVERGEDAINNFEFYAENKNIIADMIKKYEGIKFILVLLGVSSLASLVNIIFVVVDIINKTR